MAETSNTGAEIVLPTCLADLYGEPGYRASDGVAQLTMMRALLSRGIGFDNRVLDLYNGLVKKDVDRVNLVRTDAV